ncbi:hypothetical protein J7E88_12235 [Streptomyces sp. ISL-10]|uniref:hypothetical protein n=1 Tax=Streptomyces sp. ISL-10 TaxID=2819172 RepID=UPI001BEAF441|nr:hypothetical protein [Streptomyces sp. ISL-10]MBT2366054.1 hypothetical protein [Streptomyces sp. ISL-10]
MTALPIRHRAAALTLAALTLAAVALLPASMAAVAPAAADYRAISAQATPERESVRLLAQPPFSPTDLSLLSTEAHPDGPLMEPAPPRDISIRELTDQLMATLKPRGRHAVEEGFAVFRSSRITAVVPDANLRAALASLAGSPGQGSIPVIRNGLFSRVVFGVTPRPEAIAMALTRTDTDPRPCIVFNERYRYEDFRLLGDVLAHETLHRPGANNHNEEAINEALNVASYGELLLQLPRLATSRTELTRRLNTRLLALLNTRDARGRQRLTHSTGNVLPGAATALPSLAALQLGITPNGRTATDPTSTPGNANLDFYLSAITRTRQTGADFDTATVQLLDRRQAWAAPEERIRLARLLKLRLPHRPGEPHVSAQRSVRQARPSRRSIRIEGHPVRTGAMVPAGASVEAD